MVLLLGLVWVEDACDGQNLAGERRMPQPFRYRSQSCGELRVGLKRGRHLVTSRAVQRSR
jgi:hypothetical protein